MLEADLTLDIWTVSPKTAGLGPVTTVKSKHDALAGLSPSGQAI